MYVYSLTGKEIEGFQSIPRNKYVNFCPMYKSDALIQQVVSHFDYVIFDSLCFLINKNKYVFYRLRKTKKFFFVQHTLKYLQKVLKFRPNEVTMLDYHKSYFLSFLLSVPLYIVCHFKKIHFNIVVWNEFSYFLFKHLFLGYHGVSIASGWNQPFIQNVVRKEKHIHCFGRDGKETALKYNLRYDTFEWLESTN